MKTKLSRDEAIDIIHNICCADDRVRSSYSGRGMFGKICYGITTGDPDGIREEAAARGLRGASVDRMGLRYIVYWEHVAGSEEGFDDEE